MFCIFRQLCSVNYFAHYFFDHQPENVNYNLGLLAPDLLRNYSKNQYSKIAINQSNLRKDDFSIGMAQHLKRDAQFHDSIFFNQVYSQIHPQAKQAFSDSGISRFWFGTHVMIEMILDSVLIEKHPDTLIQMYQDLEKSMNHLDIHLSIIEHKNPDQFILGMQKFLESKFLFKYKSEGLIYCLNRVYRQVGAETGDWQNSNPLLELSEKMKVLIIENLSKLHI